MVEKHSQCPHVRGIKETSWADIINKKKTQTSCETCSVSGPNLWLCMHSNCLFVACGESAADHSDKHYQKTTHTLTINLTTMRIWCYQCESEVFKSSNKPPLMFRESSASQGSRVMHSLQVHSHSVTDTSHVATSAAAAEQESDEDEENDDDTKRPRGLTGLQNIGNTCYLNAALQALSNCPPLTRFFLDCPGFVHAMEKSRPPALAQSYQVLINNMWNKKRLGYVVPTAVVQGIKMVHPMFRGFTQQDTQEFLRCFMDRLHEEMKQPIAASVATSGSNGGVSGELLMSALSGRDGGNLAQTQEGDDRSCSSMEKSTISDNNSPSESDYDTCDTGTEHLATVDVERLSTSSVTAPLRGTVTPEEISDNADTLTVSDDTGISLTDDSPCSATSTCPGGVGIESSLLGLGRRSKSEGGIAAIGSMGELQMVPEGCASAQHSDVRLNQSYSGHTLQSSASLTQLVPAPGESLSGSGADGDKLAVGGKTGDRMVRDAESGRRSGNSESDLGSLRANHAVANPVTKKQKTPIEYASVISDTFDGKILSSVQCLTCDRVSVTKETFQDLSLPIPSKEQLSVLESQFTGSGAVAHRGTCGDVAANKGLLNWMLSWVKIDWFWGSKVSLQHCLAAFFSADELKGDNMYSCEKCQKLRNGEKKCRILQLPEILCIHLKRFRHDFMFSTKISTFISFPLEDLDMKPYLHNDCKDTVTKYDLVAVICHHGTSGGGHYTAYAVNEIDAQWYEFDDQYVTQVDVNQVETCDAYVLFYRKKNDHMLALRQKARQIMDYHESSLLKFYISRQWINKFNTFAEVGPITNHDFVCCHGAVNPAKMSFVADLSTEIPQKLWEFFHENFGGGPAVNHLQPCSLCQQEMDAVKRRQKLELERFQQLYEAFQKDDQQTVVYAISMSWFREWENFVKGKSDSPPDPIDNSAISVIRAGQPSLRLNSDYFQASSDMWRFVQAIYGGGPELVVRQRQGSESTLVIVRQTVTDQPKRQSTISQSSDSGISSNAGGRLIDSEAS